MTAYVLLKFLHIMLAITAVGSNITYGVWLARARREPQQLGYVLRGIKILDDRVANPSFGLLLVTGLALLFTGRIPWTTPWLLTALIAYAAVMVLGLRSYTPLLKQQIATLERTGPRSPEYERVAAQSMRVGILLAVLLVVIVFLMVTKPALWG
ncbi:MAG TPA: DUF2269 family protein [bacterium]|nr:DUF2269 family protein [bacterium]